MFDIVTIQATDAVVATAVKTIIEKTGYIAVPDDGYRLIAGDKCQVVGKGGSANTLVVVGHAGPDSISDQKTWDAFAKRVTASVDPDWRKDKTRVYLVACSTSAEGTKFGHGNIANEIKAKFPDAKVWASTTAVLATDLSGDWEVL